MSYSSNVYYFADSATVRSERIIKPFWSNKEETVNPKLKFRKRKKFIIKWIKFVVYSFTFVMILWSCVQQFAQPYTNYIPSVGQGLEFGYSPGSTGDWRFDLGSSGTGRYNVFDNYTLTYGPFFGWFVYPFAKMSLALMWGMTPSLSYGGFNALFTIIIILLIMRGIIFWPSLKGSLLSERQMEHQGALAEINAKYANIPKGDKPAKMRKQQEITQYNKKHNLNPLGMFENMFVSLPIFFIIFRLVTILRPIKSTVLFGIWDMSAVPFNSITQEFGSGGWVYIFLLIIILPVQFMGQKLPVILSKKRNPSAKTVTAGGKKSNSKNQMIQTIVSIVFLVFTVFLSSGIGVYYFFSALFTIAQTSVIHKIIVSRRKKGFSVEDKLRRFGVLKGDGDSASSILFTKK